MGWVVLIAMPVERVSGDVVTNAVEVSIVADDMVVVAPLP